MQWFLRWFCWFIVTPRLGAGVLLVAFFFSPDTSAQRRLQDLASQEGELEVRRFTHYVEQLFRVRAVCDGSNRVALRPEMKNETTLSSLACVEMGSEGDFSRAAQFWLTNRCLSQDVPEMDSVAWFELAVREEQEWLDSLQLVPCGNLSAADLLELEYLASARVQARLLATGLFDFVAGAWRRHILRRSQCFYIESRRLESLTGQLRSDGTDCQIWKRFIRVEPHPGRNLGRKIRLSTSFENSSERRAVEQLQPHTLVPCLATVLEANGDPTMMEQLGFYYGFADIDAMTDYAWKVWSEHGVLDWLKKSASRKRVPRSILRAVEECGSTWPQAPAVKPIASERTYARGGRSPWAVADDHGSGVRAVDRHLSLWRVHALFSVEIIEQGDRLVADLQYNAPVRVDDLVCRPPRRHRYVGHGPDLERDSVLTLRALEERTSIDLFDEHRAGVRAIQRWLDEQGPLEPDSLSADGLQLFHREAQIRLFEHLRGVGAFDYFRGAWRQHVLQESDWYASAAADLAASLADSSNDPLHCPPWEELLRAFPGLVHDVSLSVNLRLPPDNPSGHQSIVELEKHGLSRCLGRIRDERSGNVEKQVLRFDLSSSSRTSADHDRKLRVAMDLWRRHGVEEWVHRTEAEGDVPPDIASAIAACAAGILPPVATTDRS